jgi:hypothetical protein
VTFEGPEIIICPICRKEIHRQYAAPIQSRAIMSSRTDPKTASAMLTQMMLAADALHEKIVLDAEEACVEHYRTKHSLRLQLWKRFKWDWIMQRRWPWSRPLGETFDFSESANR